MQLFITEFEKNGDKITINNKEIAHQMKKVLRMSSGDLFFVQTKNTNDINTITRYQTSIENISSSIVEGTITKAEKYRIQTEDNNKHKTTIIVAMPNKRSKAELIVQKLSELGINNIYFWPSERSIIKDTKDKKIDRLIKIAQEATEQSRGWHMPHIEFIKDISILTKNKNAQTIIFDKSNKDQQTNHTSENANSDYNTILGVVGPEGGLTDKDYQKIGGNHTVKQLGDTILRTETASIIAGREIKKLD